MEVGLSGILFLLFYSDGLIIFYIRANQLFFRYNFILDIPDLIMLIHPKYPGSIITDIITGHIHFPKILEPLRGSAIGI